MPIKLTDISISTLGCICESLGGFRRFHNPYSPPIAGKSTRRDQISIHNSIARMACTLTSKRPCV